MVNYAIGLMSGTSVDGIDGVVLALEDNGPPKIIAFDSLDIPATLRSTLRQLATPGDNEIDQAGEAHIALGELYAELALTLSGRCIDQTIAVIGCHGQTVRHRPDNKYPFTFQLGSGALIAQRTGIPTVTDFRSADMALGGQGAPFAPFFHRALFQSPSETRAVVNLGGIANVTILDAADDVPVIGFDSGPASCLMDSWAEQHLHQPYDDQGNWGKSGRVHQPLLEKLLDDPYFSRSAPKSTGRESFNLSWLQAHLSAFNLIAPEDVQRTLCELTSQSIASAISDAVKAIYLCGGGTNNEFLVERIRQLCLGKVDTTDSLGIAPQWVEASAFAWLGMQTLQRHPSSLPSVTGACRPAVCGAVYYP